MGQISALWVNLRRKWGKRPEWGNPPLLCLGGTTNEMGESIQNGGMHPFRLAIPQFSTQKIFWGVRAKMQMGKMYANWGMGAI